MTAKAPAPPPKAAGRTRRVPWWLWVVAVAVTAVGTIALLGGFNEVPVEKLPVIELGAAQPGNEITTTITRVYLSETRPVTGYDLDEGQVAVVVEGTALNTTDRSSVLAPRLVRVLLDGVIDPDEDTEPSAIELRNGGGIEFVQPGLPTRMAWVWEVPADSVAEGDRIVVGVFERYKIEYDPVFGDTAYSDVVPVARIITTIEGSR